MGTRNEEMIEKEMSTSSQPHENMVDHFSSKEIRNMI